jgi:hypothetical protein
MRGGLFEWLASISVSTMGMNKNSDSKRQCRITPDQQVRKIKQKRQFPILSLNLLKPIEWKSKILCM